MRCWDLNQLIPLWKPLTSWECLQKVGRQIHQPLSDTRHFWCNLVSSLSLVSASSLSEIPTHLSRELSIRFPSFFSFELHLFLGKGKLLDPHLGTENPLRIPERPSRPSLSSLRVYASASFFSYSPRHHAAFLLLPHSVKTTSFRLMSENGHCFTLFDS